jgi:GTPase SAR1 family protein
VGNKFDEENERTVSRQSAQSVANQWSKFTYNFFETSAKNNINCSEVFYEIVRQIDTAKTLRKKKVVKRRKNKCVTM